MNKIKKVIIVSALGAFLALGISACGSEPEPVTASEEQLQGDSSDTRVEFVKQGHPQMIPDITYEQAYENFFARPQWRAFDSTDGKEVVEFSGECTYNDEPATVYIQFVFDDEETFSFGYYALFDEDKNEIPPTMSTMLELIYNPFETYSNEVLDKPLDEEVQQFFLQAFEEAGYADADENVSEETPGEIGEEEEYFEAQPLEEIEYFKDQDMRETVSSFTAWDEYGEIEVTLTYEGQKVSNNDYVGSCEVYSSIYDEGTDRMEEYTSTGTFTENQEEEGTIILNDDSSMEYYLDWEEDHSVMYITFPDGNSMTLLESEWAYQNVG